MPHPLLKIYHAEIEKYCEENGLSSDKAFSAWSAGDKKSVYLLGEGDPERGKLGLKDNIPLPVSLEIYVEDGKLRFEQTEHTHKYLGAEDKVARRVA